MVRSSTIRATARFGILLASAALALSAGAADAATLTVDANGILTGATGVIVNGKSYTVSFVDGDCAAAYGSCTAAAFDFTTESDAHAAAQALLDQVLIDSPAGNFDTTDITRVLGCAVAMQCNSMVAYELHPAYFNNEDYFFNEEAVNYGTGKFAGTPDYVFDIGQSPTSIDYAEAGFGDYFNFARFTLASDAPEPASWAMFVAGFGLVGGAMRSRRHRIGVA